MTLIGYQGELLWGGGCIKYFDEHQKSFIPLYCSHKTVVELAIVDGAFVAVSNVKPVLIGIMVTLVRWAPSISRVNSKDTVSFQSR